MSTETVGTIGDGEPKMSTSTFTQLLNFDGAVLLLKVCFTSTEAVRTIGDGEPRTSTWAFTQLLSSNPPPECPAGLLVLSHLTLCPYHAGYATIVFSWSLKIK